MNKQVLLGVSLMVFGSAMIAVLATAPKDTTASTTTAKAEPDSSEKNYDVARPVVEPLTADIETEARLLEEKRKQREARVAQLEEQTKALLTAQEQARQTALQKQADELTQPAVQVRPESVELAKQQERAKLEQAKKAELKAKEKQKTELKAKEDAQKLAEKQKQDELAAAKKSGKHIVKVGDNLIRLSKEYNIPVSVLAQANNMGRDDALHKGRTIIIPSAKDIKRLQAEAVAQERKQAADARLKEARQNANKSANKGSYAVQVALAANQQNADALVAKFKAQGYTVKTASDRRGVRVIVGPEKSREAADALRNKINNDKSVATGGAWVFEVK